MNKLAGSSNIDLFDSDEKAIYRGVTTQAPSNTSVIIMSQIYLNLSSGYIMHFFLFLLNFILYDSLF